MALFDLFRRQPPIREPDALAQFIDENAAFLVQKGIYEYSRARAGPYAKMMMVEPGFVASADRSRWQAYPLGLAMVGETVDVVLRLQAGERWPATLDGLIAVVLSVFDRYPTPAPLGEEAWRAARSKLSTRLNQVRLHPPKRVIDIPEPFAREYFELMPIHERLRALDFPTTRNYLRISLCNIHDKLIKRIDAQSVVDSLDAARS
jgi:hypothetical protein